MRSFQKSILISTLFAGVLILGGCNTAPKITETGREKDDDPSRSLSTDVTIAQHEIADGKATGITRPSTVGPDRYSPAKLSRQRLRDEEESAPDEAWRYNPNFNTEAYSRFDDNPFMDVKRNPLSTFSVDVDTAAYSNVRRFITEGALPPKDAVRIEEMINYFNYKYPQPSDQHPFSVNMEAGAAPWNPDHELVLMGLQAKTIDAANMPPRNLVFLVDVSGSMDEPTKLPLLKKSLTMLTDQLTENDHVAIVVYAGAAGTVLEPTSGANKGAIKASLENLHAGGSTNGGQGIQLAYLTAKKFFNKSGINRVILATDGDFNVGTTSEGDLTRLIEEKRKEGVFLTVLGFGMGNLKDSTMEQLADKGNGNYAYIDNIAEARKVLVEQAGGTLVTVAKDVKFQVEFNPAEVQAYRLIGYENRKLRDEDFNDDTKDAGEIGAGHSVTALYEIVRPGKKIELPGVDALKYQTPVSYTGEGKGEILTCKLRYKKPNSETSILLSRVLTKKESQVSENFKWAASVAMFGMVLRDSPHKGNANLTNAYDYARASLGEDRGGYRSEMLQLMRRGENLKR